jgi:predicted dehydrogenase
MKALVIGFGSIGQRHFNILNGLNINTAVVSSRDINHQKSYYSLNEAINTHQPQYIVISNRTKDHFKTLKQLSSMKWKGVVLVEKPLFHDICNLDNWEDTNIFVAYNLRFHPLIQKLRETIYNERVISVFAYVGQYLPNWRQGHDYRESYSAKSEEGGGVLRDLSHELDYLNWIFGKWTRLSSIGGKYSTLEINSVDSVSILLEMEKCPQVQLQMNYLDRIGRREIIINTANHTYKIDLISGLFQIDSKIEYFNVERNETYTSQHMDIINNNWNSLCTYSEGLQMMNMIYAVEQSEKLREWVYNE